MKLKLENLVKRFGTHTVLDRVQLDLEDVHCLALIGPSGGGKSTLLRLIAGLEIPTGGTVTLNQNPIIYRPETLLKYRRSIGTVFQAYNLFPHLTALRNITLPLEKVHGWKASAARDEAERLLTRFRLADHAHKKPAELSGGQRQRVAIVRAISVQPQVVLFDEPTSALDPEMTGEVLDVIAELKKDKRDLVIVTHEMGFARQVADQVAYLSAGTIAELGTPDQIFNSPKEAVTQRFLSRTLKY